MTTISRRTTCLLSALVAALVWTTASTNVSGQGGQGVHLTRNGFRMPIYGVSQRLDASGNAAAECVGLTAPQVDAARIGRRVSRAMVESSPQAIVRGPEGGAVFDVRYTDAEGTGFNDSREGETRRRAMEAALAAWSKYIRADQRIRVEASMHEMDDGDNDPRTTLLATASPSEFWVLENKGVPSALAWQLLGGRFDNAGESDITVEVNVGAEWDYALTGDAQENRASFVYTMMHELGHGLGLVDSFDNSTGRLLNDPLPFVFDPFVNRGSDRRNVVLDHSDEETIRDLKSRELFFNGESSSEASRAIDGRSLPMLKLYAPDPYEQGSSVSHVDQDTYEGIRDRDARTGQESKPGLIMTPLISVGNRETIHATTLAMIKDIGYTLMPSNVTPTEVGFTRPQ